MILFTDLTDFQRFFRQGKNGSVVLRPSITSRLFILM